MKGDMWLNHHGKGSFSVSGSLFICGQFTLGNRAPGEDQGFWAAVGGGPSLAKPGWLNEWISASPENRDIWCIPEKRPSSSMEDPSHG